jgi:hypothetical protein
MREGREQSTGKERRKAKYLIFKVQDRGVAQW